MNCGGDYSVDIEYKCGEADCNGYVYACPSCKDELVLRLFNRNSRESLTADEYKYIAGVASDLSEEYELSEVISESPIKATKEETINGKKTTVRAGLPSLSAKGLL